MTKVKKLEIDDIIGADAWVIVYLNPEKVDDEVMRIVDHAKLIVDAGLDGYKFAIQEDNAVVWEDKTSEAHCVVTVIDYQNNKNYVIPLGKLADHQYNIMALGILVGLRVKPVA